jgi:hypothetical protein
MGVLLLLRANGANVLGGGNEGEDKVVPEAMPAGGAR